MSGTVGTVRLRRARPDEAGRLSEVAFAAKRHWSYPDAWMSAWRDGLTFTAAFIDAHIVTVAAGPNDVARACSALVEGNGWHLEHLWVAPEHMGEGLGRRLFGHAKTEARALGATSFDIDSDPNAEPFYRRMGAVRIGWVEAEVCETRRSLPRLRVSLSDLLPEGTHGTAASDSATAPRRP